MAMTKCRNKGGRNEEEAVNFVKEGRARSARGSLSMGGCMLHSMIFCLVKGKKEKNIFVSLCMAWSVKSIKLPVC